MRGINPKSENNLITSNVNGKLRIAVPVANELVEVTLQELLDERADLQTRLATVNRLINRAQNLGVQ